MSKKGKKTIATILIILGSLFVYGLYMYFRTSEGKIIPTFSGVVFALIPAIVINGIWYKKAKEKS